MSQAVELSIVLPCYNEADNLPPLLQRYSQAWPKNLAAELILVNNGSTDQTAEVLERELAGPTYRFARTVLVPRNRGYGHGIHTGLQAACGEFLAFSHADMQCSPEDVFAAYAVLEKSPRPTAALVKGRRQSRPLGDEVLTRGMSLLASAILLTPLTDVNAQPKVFHRSLLHRLEAPPDNFAFDLYVLYQAKRAGLDVLTVPVQFGTRMHGQSKWSFSLLSRWRSVFGMMKYILHLRFHPKG